MRKIILSADSTCDLSEQIIQQYEIQIQPLHIIIGEQTYRDGVDITPKEIFATFDREKILPRTSAPNPKEYIDHFQTWTKQGYEVIHISLSSNLSAAYQNACLAADQLKNVYPIDSKNLSTGMGLLVMEAALKIQEGLSAESIVQEIQTLTSKVQASFVIDTLAYLHEGGRCSALAAYGANLLSIKPCIEVNNEQGNMMVGKKYRGSLQKVFQRYTKDQLEKQSQINQKRVFITHSGVTKDILSNVKNTVQKTIPFQEVLITEAGCTISSHCGPNTLGVLFLSDQAG